MYIFKHETKYIDIYKGGYYGKRLFKIEIDQDRYRYYEWINVS